MELFALAARTNTIRSVFELERILSRELLAQGVENLRNFSSHTSEGRTDEKQPQQGTLLGTYKL